MPQHPNTIDTATSGPFSGSPAQDSLVLCGTRLRSVVRFKKNLLAPGACGFTRAVSRVSWPRGFTRAVSRLSWPPHDISDHSPCCVHSFSFNRATVEPLENASSQSLLSDQDLPISQTLQSAKTVHIRDEQAMPGRTLRRREAISRS